ncbi:hypothetical protein N9K38_01065, partial [Flavobacteriales bacterium]|nr:hypothetical protein [Flavobacteriales bacterium]
IDGNEYTSSNTTSQYPLLSVDGCDSTIYLHLTINDSTFNTNSQIACDTYTWAAPLGDGNTYTTSGIHTHLSIDSATGCIHEETLDLTVDYSTSNTNTQIVCDSYTWAGPLGDGNTYTTSGTFINVSTNAAGCVHTENLELTVNYSSDTTDINETVCSFFTDAIGNIYDTSAIYTYVLTNASGCDSVISLDLTVNFPDSSFLSDSSCNSYTWNGITYYTTGVYHFDTLTVGGCDSIAWLDLFIGYDEIHTTVVSACDNFIWYDADSLPIVTTLNSTLASGGGPGIYGTDDTYIDTVEYTNIGGCDSIEILNLTLNSSVVSTSQPIEIFECDSWTNTFTGEVITTTGLYSRPFALTPSGCDSLRTYDITIVGEIRHDIPVTDCDSYTWPLTGLTYTTTTTDSVIYFVDCIHGPDTIQCDSIVYLNLTITNSETTDTIVTACDSYTWLGTTYTSSGVYDSLYQTNQGCDSLATLELTINYSTSGTTTVNKCDTYTWAGSLGDGNTYTTSGIHTHVSINDSGCAHTETLNLTINPVYSNTLTPVVACEEYHWNLAAGGAGVTYYSSGQYTSQFQSIDGCDSLIILDLIIDHPDNIVDSIVACDSHSWINGLTYNTSNNTDSVVLPTALGVCDSTIYLHLTINNSSSTDTTITECDSYAWAVNGTTYYTTGLYIDTSTNASGCLHIDSLELKINSSSSGATAHTACDSYSWNGSTYNSSGIYTHTSTNVAGCDHIDTLTLTIDNTIVTHQYATECYTYEWEPWNHPSLTFGFDTTSTFNAGNNELTHIAIGNSTGTPTTCTDTAYLHLTINPMVYVSSTVTACDSYYWNGTLLDSTDI